MPPFRGLGSLSLREKLSAAASAALLTAAAMTALVVFTVWNSASTAETASMAHDKVRLFGQLHASVREYQAASYAAVREPGEESARLQRVASTELQSVIERVSQLKVQTMRERETRARIARQARVVLELFRDATPLVQKVDTMWQRAGSLAAMREVSRVIAPILDLEDMLEDEIRRGESELGAAVARAEYLNRMAIIASVIFLAVALGFIIHVQLLLHTRLRPGLASLERGALEFAGGNLEHRIRLEGTDELSGLSRAFDTMAVTIAEKQQALRQTQLGLEKAVEDRTRELQSAYADLSEADRRLRTFLANVGHELRTPLTIIRGEAEVALRLQQDRTSATQESFECILDQTRSLSRMVEDMFLIARAEAGELPLDLRTFELADLAGKIASDFETLVTLGGGSIRAEVESGAWVSGDRDRLQRALTALVENALCHCQKGVSIVLRVSVDGDCAVLAVEDDGPGIDPAIVSSMFERNRRGDTSSEGTGLGLSLVKALATVHGGQVRLENLEPHGIRAVIQLPLNDQGRIAA